MGSREECDSRRVGPAEGISQVQTGLDRKIGPAKFCSVLSLGEP